MKKIHSSSLRTLMLYGTVESGRVYARYECPCQRGHIEVTTDFICMCCEDCKKKYKISRGLYPCDFDLIEK